MIAWGPVAWMVEAAVALVLGVAALLLWWVSRGSATDGEHYRRGYALLLVALLSACGGERVSSQLPVDFQGAIKDVELYHAASRDSDKTQRANLRDAWQAIAALEAQLALLGKTVDGKVGADDARQIVKQLLADLRSAGDKLDEIAEAQEAREVHYQNARALMTATLGLLQALADSSDQDAETQAKLVRGVQRTGALARKALAAMTTGGVR